MDGAFTKVLEGRRPGTALHAPEVRLVTEKGTPITVDDQPVSADIISAVVMLSASGIGTVDITLNNSRNDKANPARPMVPVWRYNALKELSFGTLVRVDYRYGLDPWTPMILARITSVDFSFPSATGAQVTLKGEDLSCLLKVKPEPPKDADKPGEGGNKDKQESELVKAELSAAAPGLKLVTADKSPFATPLLHITRSNDKTRLDFIKELAERMDYEVFVAFNDEKPITGTKAVERPVAFHFVPARSATLGTTITLAWGRDLIDFKPAFSVWDVPTEATAMGAVPQDRGKINERVSFAEHGTEILTDLHPAPGGKQPVNAVDARNTFFSVKPAINPLIVKVEKLDKARARLAAIAAMRKGMRGFLTAEISTIGLPSIRPGIHVILDKLSAPFDGVWYATQTTHTLNAAGYITKTSLRRPGMLDPKDYGKASA